MKRNIITLLLAIPFLCGAILFKTGDIIMEICTEIRDWVTE